MKKTKEEKRRLEKSRNLLSKRSSTSESTNSPSTSQSISNSESISQASDEIDHVSFYFVKHDLKGVLKCIGIKNWTPHRRDRHNEETVTDRDKHQQGVITYLTDTLGTRQRP